MGLKEGITRAGLFVGWKWTLGVEIMMDKPDGGVDLGHSHEDPVSGC